MLSSGQHLTSGRLKDSWKIATQLLSRGSHRFFNDSVSHFTGLWSLFWVTAWLVNLSSCPWQPARDWSRSRMVHWVPLSLSLTLTLYLSLCFSFLVLCHCHCILVGQVLSSHHSSSRPRLEHKQNGPLSPFVFVFDFDFVFVFSFFWSLSLSLYFGWSGLISPHDSSSQPRLEHKQDGPFSASPAPTLAKYSHAKNPLAKISLAKVPLQKILCKNSLAKKSLCQKSP